MLYNAENKLKTHSYVWSDNFVENLLLTKKHLENHLENHL